MRPVQLVENGSQIRVHQLCDEIQHVAVQVYAEERHNVRMRDRRQELDLFDKRAENLLGEENNHQFLSRFLCCFAKPEKNPQLLLRQLLVQQTLRDERRLVLLGQSIRPARHFQAPALPHRHLAESPVQIV